MSPAPLTVPFGAPLDEAWQLMRAHGVKALPVVDRYQHLMGIVTRADFLRLAGIGPRDGLGERLRRALQPTPGPASDKPEVVGQIMTRQVRVASATRPLAELVPLFAGSGHHHVPVIGDGNRLVGMITQTDVVAALLHDTPAA
jgi:CBS domain-containing membrane protein